MTDIPEVYPEGCKLLIQADTAETVTAGGIIIPVSSRDTMQRALTTGTVLRIGPLADTSFAKNAPEFGPGSRIIFAKYGGFNLKDPDRKAGRDFRLINDEDVLAVLGKE